MLLKMWGERAHKLALFPLLALTNEFIYLNYNKVL